WPRPAGRRAVNGAWRILRNGTTRTEKWSVAAIVSRGGYRRANGGPGRYNRDTVGPRGLTRLPCKDPVMPTSAAQYSSGVRELPKPPRTPPLDAGSPVRSAGEQLRAASMAGLFAPAAVRDRTMGNACLSGLWLWFNYLDESHSLSQEIHTIEGSFWHGIMH